MADGGSSESFKSVSSVIIVIAIVAVLIVISTTSIGRTINPIDTSIDDEAVGLVKEYTYNDHKKDENGNQYSNMEGFEPLNETIYQIIIESFYEEEPSLKKADPVHDFDLEDYFIHKKFALDFLDKDNKKIYDIKNVYMNFRIKKQDIPDDVNPKHIYLAIWTSEGWIFKGKKLDNEDGNYSRYEASVDYSDSYAIVGDK